MELLEGALRDYHRDPFPHSLLRTRKTKAKGVTIEIKNRALEKAKNDMAPVAADMKEAVRRIKAAGFKPSKSTDSDRNAEK